MNMIHLETIQRGALPDIDDVRPLSDADFEVLKEIGEILRRHNSANRFGVCLLHKHFDLNEGEELIEETDIEKRTSITRAHKISARDERTIETMWRFQEGFQTITRCVARCVYNNGHSRMHHREPG
ncbi:hypothetical protein ACU5P1_04855 [Pseudomonas plecoglossicida]|uniref:hypothetical protein n=1 Tax=Pseudomonas plecoglossicida TaxID=70775 RepID=UPI0011845428|nr:hypothetical protein [Pseudomonas plecoglossicida]QLB54182.1 hypothetical protein HAV28_04805 [Pseudomonas plecoglossicida]GLR38550.1 hypothetical protein GCM10011247_39480 [Pseudomonas plecoglossicida]